MVILYRSNTGFTREYAQMLSKAEKLKCFELGSESQPRPGEEIFYMGSLMAGHITGLDQAMSEDTSAAVRVGVDALKLLIQRDRARR